MLWYVKVIHLFKLTKEGDPSLMESLFLSE